MKLFTIDNNGKFIQFKENNFQNENKEIDLEILLENNPEYFFKNEKILIIRRQVTTNHNTFIDLLGIDIQGNTVTIELKRNKTPRETIAQILEYASYIENLNYEQLNDIFQNYSGDEISLDEYHQQYFDNNDNNKVSFNKTTKLFIIAQNISSEIKQTALFLYKKGIEIYCVEFKYFVNKTNQKIISSNFVVGNEIFFNKETKSTTRLPKVNKEKFISS
ncbi:MAG: endonuclease NucS [Bacteroidota bacterium]|nr:endonuclease NucS [Bacteroidota bacterium]